MKYKSGEEIRTGDRALFHGEPAEIAFVVERLTGDPAMDWYMSEQGPGIMVLEPKRFGHVFVRSTENREDLRLVARA